MIAVGVFLLGLTGAAFVMALVCAGRRQGGGVYFWLLLALASSALANCAMGAAS